MRLTPLLLASTLLATALPGLAAADLTDGDTTPIVVDGVRTVDLRNSTGGLSRYTTIPSMSLFATTGGRTEPCTYQAFNDGVTSDGRPYTAGTTITSTRWVFTETKIVTGGEMDTVVIGDSRGPLSTAMREFMVSCDMRQNLMSLLLVPPTDPMLDPHLRLDGLYNQLQLEPPTVWPNPVVAKWGGLVTRFPSWLAIGASAWRTQRSNIEYWRGWALSLISEPTDLMFWVVFTPDPERPSTPFNGLVPCVAADTNVPNTDVMFPALPTMLDQAPPGVNWPCMWTPPGPGQVTIQAIINYHVTFWVSGYTETLPDYLWWSEPATFRTGDLPAVNTNN